MEPNKMRLFETYFLKDCLGFGCGCDWVKQAASNPELLSLQPNQTKLSFQQMVVFQKIMFPLNRALRKSAFAKQKDVMFFFFFFFFYCAKT